MGIERRGPGEYFLNVRVKKDGKEIRKRETFKGSFNAAEDRYFEIKRELRDGAAASLRAPQTFAHILTRYRESRGEIPRSQLPIYTALLEDLGSAPLAALPDKVSQYANILRKLPSKRSGKRLANGTLNRYRAMIFAALNLAVELGALEKMPISNAHFPKQKEIPRDRFLSPLEAQNLLNVIDREAPHLSWLVRFNLQVPSRKSELVKMRREDLDLFNNAIRVHNGSTKSDEGAWKPIPPGPLVAYFRSLPADCPYLFYRVVKGGYRPLGDFKRAWGRCLRLAGITDFRVHDGRHIAATNMADAGTPERAIMDVAGWKTNMLGTYYKSSSRKALGLVRFSPGNALPSGHQVDTSREDGREIGDTEVKTANL